MWINLTENRFADGLLPAEKAAFDKLKARPGNTASEIMVREIAGTVNWMRGFCPKQEMVRGEGLTIPDEMEDNAYAVLRMKYFAAMPDLRSFWSTARNEQFLQAREDLKLWARGLFNVTYPEVPAAEAEQATGVGAEVFELNETGWEGYR